MAATSAWPSAESSEVMVAWPAFCVAITTNESLVEVSPSMVTRLNEAVGQRLASGWISDGSIFASVAMKPSMVAMFGRIMPAPLLMPVMVTVAPPICTRWLNALGMVSVVMMPSAARAQWFSDASASAAGRPASMRSTGSGSMITPVENGRICSGAMSRWRASAMQVERVRIRPSSPVPALALPVLMTIARMPKFATRWSRQTCTGAAQKRFCVNTPPTAEPSSMSTTVRSLRLALRTPASATPMRTPGTANKAAGSGADRFTGMGVSLRKLGGQLSLPWHCLNFLPLPQGHGSLRPTRPKAAASALMTPAAAAARRWLSSSTRTSTSPVSVGAL
jgi:hypothetical protein